MDFVFLSLIFLPEISIESITFSKAVNLVSYGTDYQNDIHSEIIKIVLTKSGGRTIKDIKRRQMSAI